ncbi:MAG TPA: Dyp-type peroxidase [Polyangiaceae bacterium]|nr:Dyp-type peroxidase [Polyangiaceae bacterium]
MTTLVHQDIQGNILQGLKQAEVVEHVFISLRNDADVEACRRFLGRLLDEDLVATAASDPSDPSVTVGVSYEALARLAPRVTPFVKKRFNAYARGMARRSREILNEARGVDQAAWDDRHVWLTIHGGDDANVDATLAKLESLRETLVLSRLAARGRVIPTPDKLHRLEHFGFRDDVSNPVVEGRPGDKSCIGNGKLDAHGEWVPISTGEFLLGYPNERGSNVLDGAPPDVCALFKNGTFAVFRDLEQHVAAFHRYVKEQEKRTRDTQIAARMFGRHRDGRPLERPNSQNPNDFTYALDARGAHCPLGAHVRRANPRLGGEHRLLRRGMPYGAFSQDGSDGSRRGIYFVALNASIEDQFEFLQRTWINGPPRDGSNGTDPIAASCRTERRMVVEGEQHTDRKPQLLMNIPEFVTFRGGQYYFMPGIGGLRSLCSAVRAFAGEPAPAEPRSRRSAIPNIPLRKRIAITVQELLGVRHAVSFRWAKVGEGGLYTREFTALLGVVGDVAKLKKLLEEENSREKRYELTGIQSLRWVLFQPTQDRDSAEDPSAPWVLALSFVFDGELDDALAEFIARAEPHDILTFCKDFAPNADIAKYLRRHRVESGFLFRDLGPLQSKVRPGGFVVDATRKEIAEATQLQSDFEDFYLNDPGPAGRAERFFQKFGDRARLVPLSRFERRLPDEARWIRRLSELSVSVQKSIAAARKDETRHRGAHAKGHCLLRGKLRVVETERRKFNHGVFANPDRSFDIDVRLSNGSPELQSDRKRDARGLAIRVHLGGGAKAELQDFILFSDPVFFAKDLRQFTTIFGILATKQRLTQLGRLVGFLVKARTLKPLHLIGRVLFKKPIGHPLAIEYHSATPYLLGDDLVVKHSVEAVDRAAFAKLPPGKSEDFLRRAVSAELGSAPIRLAFYVHILPIAEKKLSPDRVRDIVEDATMDWQKLGAQKIQVAELELFPVASESDADLKGAEDITFNPWNGLDAHRPLGSLNRARLTAYRDSAGFRKAGFAVHQTTPPPAARSSSEHPAELPKRA